MTFNQYNRDSTVPAGFDKSTVMHTAELPILNELNGACNRFAKILPPPTFISLVLSNLPSS